MSSGLWDVYVRDDRVVMVVRGVHTCEAAIDCSMQVTETLASVGPSDLVIDLRELSSFERSARQQWQRRLFELRPYVTKLVMVGGSPLARMAGAAVCLFARIKMAYTMSLEEALEASRPGAVM